MNLKVCLVFVNYMPQTRRASLWRMLAALCAMIMHRIASHATISIFQLIRGQDISAQLPWISMAIYGWVLREMELSRYRMEAERLIGWS